MAKLKAERYSESTIHMYVYHVRRYLKHNPIPTKLGIQSYLAARLERISTAIVSNERKSLSSFFSFIHSEGLWPINYLLNGGDIFSLKEILGHTTLDMVNHYLHFTSSQITAQHHKFSPTDKLQGETKHFKA